MSTYSSFYEDIKENSPQWNVITKHFTSTWRLYPSSSYPQTKFTNPSLLVDSPRIVKIFSIHHSSIIAYQGYSLNLARKSGLKPEEESKYLSIADTANEQRCWRGGKWACADAFTKNLDTFIPCADPRCSVCLSTRGIDKNWGRLGNAVYLSTHSSKSHVYCQSSVPNLYAMILCRTSMGKVYTLNPGQNAGRWEQPPPEYNSVLADFQVNFEENHPVDDPSVALYDICAVYPGYIVVYKF